MHFIEEGFPPHPRCHRAVCAACHSARDGERVVNTGIEADLGEDGFYAYVYLCESCVSEWGRDLGQLDVPQVEALREDLAAAKAEAAEAAERLASYARLDELVRRYAGAEPVAAKPKSAK